MAARRAAECAPMDASGARRSGRPQRASALCSAFGDGQAVRELSSPARRAYGERPFDACSHARRLAGSVGHQRSRHRAPVTHSSGADDVRGRVGGGLPALLAGRAAGNGRARWACGARACAGARSIRRFAKQRRTFCDDPVGALSACVGVGRGDLSRRWWPGACRAADASPASWCARRSGRERRGARSAWGQAAR